MPDYPASRRSFLSAAAAAQVAPDLVTSDKRVAAMFVLFHRRICCPLANSLFHHRPEVASKPPAKIETAYHKADVAIQKLIDLLAA